MMKKKPILFNKVKQKDKSRITIGIVGTHSGVGVTYTSLMLAFYLGDELGKKTALLEVNNHDDLNILQTAYQWSAEDNHSFSFGYITCYKKVTKKLLVELLNDNYERFILDFGWDLSNNRDEFLRCTTKIIVGSHAVWNLYKLKQFIKSVEHIRGNETWLYLIPGGEEKAISLLRKELNRHIYGIPLERDPIMLSRESLKLFSSLFNPRT